MKIIIIVTLLTAILGCMFILSHAIDKLVLRVSQLEDKNSEKKQITMTAAQRIRLTAQIAVLKEVAIEYHGHTIDNIIRQMEARIDEQEAI